MVTSAPVFVAATEALAADRVTLDGREGHHAAQVRRVRVGEHVDVVDGVGTRAHCVVAVVERGRVELSVDSRMVEAPPAPRLVVIQALAKGDRGERAVELLTEVGVDEVVPWSAERSIVRWRGAPGDRRADDQEALSAASGLRMPQSSPLDHRGGRAYARWVATAQESSKQARRARFPVIAPLAGTEEVAARMRAAALAIVLAAGAPQLLTDLVLPVDGDVVLVVGPEGDLTDAELAAFLAAGAQRAGLGPTVLRTSTAGVVAATVVLSRCRWSPLA